MTCVDIDWPESPAVQPSSSLYNRVRENGQSHRICSDAFRDAIEKVIATYEHDLSVARRDIDQKGVDVQDIVFIQARSTTEYSVAQESPQQMPRSILCSQSHQSTNHRASIDHSSGEDFIQRISRVSSSIGSKYSSATTDLASRYSKTASVTRVHTNNEEIASLYERGDFGVREMWHNNAGLDVNARQLQLAEKSASMTKTLDNEIRQYDAEYTHAEPLKGCAAHVMSSPASPRRIVWELAGIILVLCDLILIPMVLAFDPPRNPIVDVLDWAQLFYWPINVAIVLTTGYIEKGVLYLNPKKVFIKYVKTWFIIDLVTIVPDWFFTMSKMFSGSTDDSSSTGAFVRLLRIVRLMRLARLLRLVKLRNAWMMIYDMIDSEKIGIVLEILKMVVVLMLVNHYVACMWFTIGNSDNLSNWISTAGFAHVTWGHQYVVSFHWSITQFTPASMNIQAENATERIFAIIVVVFALVGFSYLVGSITGSLSRLRAMSEEKINKFWLLRRFLKKNHIPKELSMRIKSYSESMWDHQQSNMKEDNVQVLSLLSDHLRAELRCALHGPSLRMHPLFDRLHVDSPVTLRRLASQGIETLSLAPQDILFAAGEEATHMSILTDGRMEYQRLYNQSPHPEQVDSGEDWIAEHCIWVNAWVHLGDIKAELATELLRLSPDVWFQIASLNPIAFRLASGYAGRYAEWLNAIEKANLSDVTQGDEKHRILRNFIDPPSSRAGLRQLDPRHTQSGLCLRSPRSSMTIVRDVFKVGWRNRGSGNEEKQYDDQ